MLRVSGYMGVSEKRVVSEKRGTLLRVPIIRILLFWGMLRGTPLFLEIPI